MGPIVNFVTREVLFYNSKSCLSVLHDHRGGVEAAGWIVG